MKRKIKILSLLLCVLLTAGSLCSCFLLDGGGLSAEDVEKLLNQRLDGNITIESGDNYDVEINTTTPTEQLAAGKALLSAVSVYCNFETRLTGSFGTGGGKKQYSSAGSGVIYKLDKEHGDAYVVTNYHVVYDYRANTRNKVSDDISVYLYGQEDAAYAIPATYVGGSMNYDLAVLKIDGSRMLAESSAMAVTLHDSEDVAVLDTAIAIGNPESKGISATFGHVNVESEYITMLGSDNVTEILLRVMRVDTAVNSGNSGGGLFNAKGELIGIVNAKMADSSVDNIGYAIPSNVVRNVTENIIEHCDGTTQETITRCLLGIEVSVAGQYIAYDPDTGRVLKKESVSVARVSADSLAEGRISEGDVVRSITVGGKTYTVDRKHVLVDSMLTARVGETVSIVVLRGESEVVIEIEITEASVSYPK